MIIGIEIGGTKTQIALADTSGKIEKTIRGKVDREAGSQGILNWIEWNMKELLTSQKKKECDIQAIGIGFGGPVETKTGVILKSVQIVGWDNFNLKSWFENKFGIPVYIYNDSSAAGYGEYILGSGKNKRNFFYTNMGTGVGGSLIIDGKLYDGQGIGAAELGQIRVPDWTAENPHTDVKLEQICSGYETERRLRQPGYVPENSCLMELCGGDINKITCEMLGASLKKGDAFAKEEINRIAKTMGIAIASLLCLIPVERVAIGGGFSMVGNLLIEKIREYTREREFIINCDRYDIVPCELGEAIVLNGAVLLAAEEIRKRN